MASRTALRRALLNLQPLTPRSSPSVAGRQQQAPSQRLPSLSPSKTFRRHISTSPSAAAAATSNAVPVSTTSSSAADADYTLQASGPRTTVAPTTNPLDVDWTTSYYGLATRPFPKEVVEVLAQPIPAEDIEVKPDGILYLPEIKYRRILQRAFGPGGWGLVPKADAVVGEKVVTREYVLVADGRFISQAQGENGYFGIDQLPSAVEGCKSNALMRCCKDIGVASELWDPTFIRTFKRAHAEQVWVEHGPTKKKRQIWIKKGESVDYPYKRV